jgi:hypothetical protein
MATVTSIAPLSLPVAGGDMDAEPITNQLTNILTFLNDSGLIDEDNVNLSAIVGITTAQTITGQKTFSTAPVVNDNAIGRIRVYNNSGGAFSAGDALSFSGYNSGTGLYEVSKAVATQSNATTFYADCFADAAISNGAQGNACFMRVLTGIDTSGLTAKRPVWLSSTAGGWLGNRSDFADTDFRAQIVGKVDVVHASTGRIVQYAGSVIPYSVAWDI